MENSSHKRKSRGQPYVQKIRLGDNNEKTKRKLCSDCRETKNCVKLISNKLDRIEDAVNNFDKNLSDQNNAQSPQYSKFNARFTMNNVPCELEYNLTEFSLENLQTLVIVATTVMAN